MTENNAKVNTVTEKSVSKFELPEDSLKGQPRTKSMVKPTWSKKITVLSTFLKS